MVTISPQEKLRMIEKRILREIAEYFAQHGKGMPIRILSSRYSKSLNSVTPFPEFMDELRRAGKLEVEYSESGARTVWPAGVILPRSERGEASDRAPTDSTDVEEPELKPVSVSKKEWF